MAAKTVTRTAVEEALLLTAISEPLWFRNVDVEGQGRRIAHACGELEKAGAAIASSTRKLSDYLNGLERARAAGTVDAYLSNRGRK